METVVERPAALDVHKEQVTACVRVPGEGRAREQHVAEFSTTVAGLLTLRDWLAAFGVQQVVIEATGVYWKPIWAILEDEFECLLVNARHVKQVPGRKTDVKDAEWLCQLAEAGLLRASFVPPKPIRALRNLTRYRKTQIQERAREANRLHKALEDTGIKLDRVASDILGKSGRLMLDALVAGTTDPGVLADLAKGRLRSKIPALRESLEGRFDHLHAVWTGAILNHLDFLDEQITSLTEAIGEQIAPFEAAVELLCTIPGVQRRNAECIIAEIGVDMSVFPTDKQLASWAGQDPPRVQMAGLGAGAISDGRDPHQRRVPRRPKRPPATPPRPQESPRSRQALDPDRLLAHALNRRAVRRSRRRLLSQTRPRTHHQTTRRSTPSARTPGHPRGATAGRLTQQPTHTLKGFSH